MLAIVHDLALAARFADRVLVMDRGRIVADGAPREALSPERIAQVFGVEAMMVDDAAGRHPGAAPAALAAARLRPAAGAAARFSRSDERRGGASGSISSASRRPTLVTRPSVTRCATSAIGAERQRCRPACGARSSCAAK